MFERETFDKTVDKGNWNKLTFGLGQQLDLS